MRSHHSINGANQSCKRQVASTPSKGGRRGVYKTVNGHVPFSTTTSRPVPLDTTTPTINITTTRLASISITTTRPRPPTQHNADDPTTSQCEGDTSVECRSEGGRFWLDITHNNHHWRTRVEETGKIPNNTTTTQRRLGATKAFRHCLVG